MFRVRPGVVLCLLVIACSPLHLTSWQSVTGTLLGSVTDASGAVVPNAPVIVTETSTNITRRVQTNEEGIYNLPYLPPGQYRVEIEVQGFSRFERAGLTLQAGATVRVDVALKPGTVTETVNVTAVSPVLQTDSAEVSQTFEPKQITELPIANRSAQALVGLMPGVTPPVANFPATEDPQGTTFFQANGQGNGANNTQVDGVDNTNPTLGLTIYLPPAELVQDVQVVTSNYSAEYGRAGGAMVNIVTRGGTNDFHGSLFEFHRNTDLRARNFFNTVDRPKPTFIQNQFGGTLGGPIRRDKTFFVGSFQAVTIRRASTVTTSSPVAAWRAGDFAGVPGLSVFDPLTGNPDGTGRLQFADNRIPGSRISPVAQRLVELIPSPNQPGFTNNLVVNVPFRQNSYIYDGRVDHNFSESTRMFAKFNFSDYGVTEGSPLGEIGQATQASDYTSTSTVDITHAFSPTLLTELRLGYNRYFVDVNGVLDRPLSSELGIVIPAPSPESVRGLTSINVAGMAAMGARPQDPLKNVDNNFNLVNSWAHSFGRHQLKFGADIRHVRMDRRTSAGPIFFSERGRFDFNPGITSLRGGPALGPFGAFGNSFAALLVGLPDLSGRSEVATTPSDRMTQFFTFFHDTWHVSRNLTLDLGIRYEVYSTIKPRLAAGGSNYDPAADTLLIAGVGDVPMSMGVELDRDNFAPRIGLAWRISNATVIRAGYGLSYFVGRFGFTGGTFGTQFPSVLHTQVGVANDFVPAGTINAVPAAERPPIPANGRISPAPNQPLFAVPFSNPTPFVHSYSFTVQHEIGYGVRLEAGYVGSLGRRLPYSLPQNIARPGEGAAGRALFRSFGRTADATLRATGMNNNYNSLQAGAVKRFSQGFTFTVAYTWSKALSTGDDQGSFINNIDLRGNYGPTAYDRRHMLTTSHVYELPFGPGKPFVRRGWASRIAGGWQLSGILRAVSGTRFTGIADATPCNCPGNGNYADALRPVKLLKGAGPGQLWFDTSAFGQPGPNRFGNAGRNTIQGPGLVNYDVSIIRNFAIRERVRLELRGEFYNITNTPHFNNPVNNFNLGNFGQITAAYGERDVQLALRITF